jgi:uncharacterized protein (UPF0335 family)
MPKKSKIDAFDDEESETRIVRGVGDNSGDKPVEGKKLQGFIDRIQKIEAKKAQILQELREEYADAKSIGYDTKTIRAIIKELREEPEKRAEKLELLRIYKDALGLLEDE